VYKFINIKFFSCVFYMPIVLGNII